MSAPHTPTTTDTPKVSITIPQPAAADLLQLIDRYPEAVTGEHRVAVRAALLGATLLGKRA